MAATESIYLSLSLSASSSLSTPLFLLLLTPSASLQLWNARNRYAGSSDKFLLATRWGHCGRGATERGRGRGGWSAHAAKRVKATRNQFSTIKESIYLTELANWRLTAGAAARLSSFRLRCNSAAASASASASSGAAAVARRVLLLCEHVLLCPAPLGAHS